MQKHIIIDIGHQDNDSGAVNKDGIREVDINLAISKYLIAILQRHNVKVTVTTGTLANRVKVEHSLSPDLFVSIHTNAGGGDGSEVFCYKLGSIEERLGKLILNYIVNMGVNNSRGVKQANFYVLSKTYCPAILVETAFIDSVDFTAIDEEHEKEAMATAIAKGILEHFRIDYKEDTKEPDTKTMFRVCVGSYADRENAKKILEKAKQVGFSDAFITTVEV